MSRHKVENDEAYHQAMQDDPPFPLNSDNGEMVSEGITSEKLEEWKSQIQKMRWDILSSTGTETPFAEQFLILAIDDMSKAMCHLTLAKLNLMRGE